MLVRPARTPSALARGSIRGRSALEHALAALVAPCVLVLALDPPEPWSTAAELILVVVWAGIAGGLIVRARTGRARRREPGGWLPEVAALSVVAAVLAAGASPAWALVAAISLQLVRVSWLAPALRAVAGRWHVAVLALTATLASGSAFAAIEDRGWGDGVWWSICTMTTVGYGDIAPRTTAGRTIGAITMLVGIALLTALVATVARTLMLEGEETEARGTDHLSALAAEVRRLHDRLDLLGVDPSGHRPTGR